MPGFFQLKILCEAPCRTYNSAGKMFFNVITEAGFQYFISTDIDKATINMQGREILQSTVDLVQNMLNLEVRPLVWLTVIAINHCMSNHI